MNSYDVLVSQILEANKKSKKEDVEIDSKKADLNKDGKLSSYEKKRAEAIESAMKKKKEK